jgi:hypothetical protein
MALFHEPAFMSCDHNGNLLLSNEFAQELKHIGSCLLVE